MERISKIIPTRSQIWLADLEPSIGDEVRKTRPVLIVGRNGLCPLRLAIICPIRARRRKHDRYDWLIKVTPDANNGLDKVSSIDAFQVRCVSFKRMIAKIGELDDETVATVARTVAVCVGFQISDR